MKKVKLDSIFGVVIAIVLMGIVGYFPLFSNETFHLDDPMHLSNSPTMQSGSFEGFKKLWTDSHAGAYTPVTSSVWFLITKVAHSAPLNLVEDVKLRPKYYRWANILFHLLTSIVLGFILWGWTGKNLQTTLIGSLLFCLHPIHVESVAWITELRGVLGGFFMMLALYFWGILFDVQKQSHSRTGWITSYICVLIFTSLSFLSKPTFLFAPLFFLWVSIFVFKKKKLNEIIYIVPICLLALVTYWVMGPLNEAGLSHLMPRLNILEKVWVSWDTASFYVVKILFPIGLGFDYGRTPQYVLDLGLTNLFLMVPLVVIAFWHFKLKSVSAQKMMGIVGLFLIPLSVVLGGVPFIYQHISTVADRYAYFSLVAVPIGMVILYRKSEIPYPGRLALMGFVAFSLIQSHVQSRAWKTTESLYLRSLEVNPQSWYAANNLAQFYETEGKTEASRDYFKLAAESSDKPLIWNNYGMTCLRLGEIEEAELAFKNGVVAAGHVNASLFNNLGTAQTGLRKYQKARESFQKALEINPDSFQAKHNLTLLPPIGEEDDQSYTASNKERRQLMTSPYQ